MHRNQRQICKRIYRSTTRNGTWLQFVTGETPRQRDQQLLEQGKSMATWNRLASAASSFDYSELSPVRRHRRRTRRRRERNSEARVGGLPGVRARSNQQGGDVFAGPAMSEEEEAKARVSITGSACGKGSFFSRAKRKAERSGGKSRACLGEESIFTFPRLAGAWLAQQEETNERNPSPC